jgi:hypothetical protein
MTEEMPGVTRITREEWEVLMKMYLPKISCEIVDYPDESIVKAKFKGYIDCPPYGIRSGIAASFTEEALRYTTAEITEYNARACIGRILTHLGRKLLEQEEPLSGSYEGKLPDITAQEVGKTNE